MAARSAEPEDGFQPAPESGGTSLEPIGEEATSNSPGSGAHHPDLERANSGNAAKFSTPGSNANSTTGLINPSGSVAADISSVKGLAVGSCVLSFFILAVAVCVMGLSAFTANEIDKTSSPASQFEAALRKMSPGGSAGAPSTWEKISPVGDEPTGRFAHAAATADDMLYIHGGITGSKTDTHSDMWRYHEGKNEWTRLDTSIAADKKPSARLHHSLIQAGSGSDSLLLFGGFNNFQGQPGHKSDNQLWQYSISKNEWTRLDQSLAAGSAVPPTSGAHDCVWLRKAMYCFGGFSVIGATGHRQTMFKFDLAAKTWTNVTATHVVDATWPDGRIGFALAALDDRYAFLYGGGCSGDDASSGQCRDAWKWDADTNTFSEYVVTGAQPSHRRATHGDISAYGLVFLFGGLHIGMPGPTFTLHDDLWVFDPAASTWMQLFPNYNKASTRPGKRFGHSVSRLNNRLVVFGGRDGSPAHPGTNELWEYTIVKPF